MASYEGIELYGGPIAVKLDGTKVGGYIQAPENIPHYYVETGDANVSKLQVVTVGVDSQGTQPPEPPAEFRAPNYHSAAHATGDVEADVTLGLALISQGLTLVKGHRVDFIGPPVPPIIKQKGKETSVAIEDAYQKFHDLLAGISR